MVIPSDLSLPVWDPKIKIVKKKKTLRNLPKTPEILRDHDSVSSLDYCSITNFRKKKPQRWVYTRTGKILQRLTNRQWSKKKKKCLRQILKNQYFRKSRSEGTCPLVDMTAVIRPGTCNAKTKTKADRSGCGASAAGRLVFFSTGVCVCVRVFFVSVRVCIMYIYFFFKEGTTRAVDPLTQRIILTNSKHKWEGLAPIPPPKKIHWVSVLNTKR